MFNVGGSITNELVSRGNEDWIHWEDMKHCTSLIDTSSTPKGTEE